MCSMTVIRLSLFFSLQFYLRLAKSESILIIALPQSDTKVSASWERGEEILPGALAAIEEAKNDPFLFNVTLFMATSGPVTSLYDYLPYSGDVLEIIANLTWQKRASDIIGIAGVLHPNMLAVLNKFQLPTASLVHFNINNSISYMTASISILTDSILEFLKEINPKKIGIITEFNQPYYLTVSSELSTKANVSLYSQIISKHHTSLSDVAERVLASNVHTILLSAGPSTAISMLCEAYEKGLTWPKYAWILHSYRLDDLLRSSESNEGCSVEKILEGVFIFQLTKERSSFNSETTYCIMCNGGNPYAYLLHNSVWALIRSVDTMSFNETLSPFHFKSVNSAKVYVYHNLNSTASLLGTYDGRSRTLTNVSEIIFTDYDLPVINKGKFLVHYLLPLPILSFIFNTILLILYIVFHNEPSIKSTSVSLSMFLLIGCYTLVGYTVFLTYMQAEPYQVDFCMTLIWLGGVGLSIPLIFATILVKMLRVYHIFTTFKVLKRNAHLSDCALFVYTILIISPNIILLTVWTAVDPQHRVNHHTEHPGFIEIKVTCRSSSDNIWFALLLAYSLLLATAVIIVAVKSRKIRLARFKDTKKVNLLIFLLYIVGICTFSYWRLFFDLGFIIPSRVIVYSGHILMAFLCQIILIVPKIWPALCKKESHY